MSPFSCIISPLLQKRCHSRHIVHYFMREQCPVNFLTILWICFLYGTSTGRVTGVLWNAASWLTVICCGLRLALRDFFMCHNMLWRSPRARKNTSLWGQELFLLHYVCPLFTVRKLWEMTRQINQGYLQSALVQWQEKSLLAPKETFSHSVNMKDFTVTKQLKQDW